jgi:hypothetical protein
MARYLTYLVLLRPPLCFLRSSPPLWRLTVLQVLLLLQNLVCCHVRSLSPLRRRLGPVLSMSMGVHRKGQARRRRRRRRRSLLEIGNRPRSMRFRRTRLTGPKRLQVQPDARPGQVNCTSVGILRFLETRMTPTTAYKAGILASRRLRQKRNSVSLCLLGRHFLLRLQSGPR